MPRVPGPLGQIPEAFLHTLHFLTLWSSRVTLKVVSRDTIAWPDRVSLLCKDQLPVGRVLNIVYSGPGQVILNRKLCYVFQLPISEISVSYSSRSPF